MQSIIVKWVTNVNIEEQIYTQVDGPLKYFIHQKRAKCIEHRSFFLKQSFDIFFLTNTCQDRTAFIPLKL